MARELGEYRDPHLEMETLARKSGPILESAVQMLVKIHAPHFTQTGPDLRHRKTGETIEDFVKGRRKSNPNDYADWTPDDPDQLMHLYSEEAFGAMCSPKTVGRLFTFMKDPARFAALAKAWGCDTVKMLPGVRPGAVGDGGDKPKPKGTGENNPFNPAKTYAGGDTVRQNEIAKFIRLYGTKAAANSAQKFGTDLAGRPLRPRA
jgi:hypothetical protein